MEISTIKSVIPSRKKLDNFFYKLIEMSTPSGDAIDLMVMSQTVMHIIDEYPINNMGLDQVNVVVDKLEKLRMDILKAQMRVNISKEELPEDCKLSINQSLFIVHQRIHESSC